MYSCLILNNPYNNLVQTAMLSKAAQRGADQIANEGKSCHSCRPVTTFTPCAAKHSVLVQFALLHMMTIKINICAKMIRKLLRINGQNVENIKESSFEAE